MTFLRPRGWISGPGPGEEEGWPGRLTATQLFLLSFVGMILVGTLGYLLLPGLYEGQRLGVVDALFTATSAVCVTGLIVVDTATRFTVWGQAWTLLLIQAGGLGVLTFTTLIATALGRRSSVEIEEAAGGHAAYLEHTTGRGLVRTVVLVTLALEAIGAAGLWLAWRDRFPAGEAVWHAVFNAVSAFCNAGFSTFSDSLAGFRESPVTVLTVGALIVLGGIGFVVIQDLRARYGVHRKSRRLTVHSKLVLGFTAVLLAAAWALFLIFEWRHELAGLGTIDRLVNALFMAVTPRTAGFNTVDYATATNASLFLTILLMLIGGSPGSTAGGFKTTTVALLFLLLRSRLRGEEHVSIFDRTVPRETVQRAAGLTIGGLAVLGSAVFALSVTELGGPGVLDRSRFFAVIFEAHSAFGTVGLSMGATPELSTLGRLIVTLLMFLGRVGPIAVVASMTAAFHRTDVAFRYGEEDVIIG